MRNARFPPARRATRVSESNGEKLHKEIISGLPDGWELDEREHANLGLACRQLEDLETLEDAIERDGTMVAGSKGQPVVNPAIAEARQARLALNRLLGSIELPDAAGAPRSEASRRGQKAARSRWDRRVTKLHREGGVGG
jgi:hypothetical protein